MKKINVLITLLLILGLNTKANNLRIRNIAVNLAAQTVTFDIAWDNSWRLSNTQNPKNWDAAWVFVKFRACDSPATAIWEHALISTNLADHSFGNLEPTLSDGSAVGIDPAPNNTGVMLRRNSVGIFPNAGFTTVTLKLTNIPTSGSYDVRVFGIEMVYIPQGAYLLGSLNGYYSNWTEGAYSFSPDCNCYNCDRRPYYITSETDTTLTWARNCTGVALPATFPKGYKPFYIMKYEITQGQYAMFLNTISALQAPNRYPGNYNNNRNRLSNTGTPPFLYRTDRKDRAQGYLSWHDVMAYLDWAALRPMTELEFEKAARGAGQPSFQEYPWGTTRIVAATGINKTPEDGTEEVSTPIDANACYNNITFTGGDGGRGPLRVGIFAKPTSSSRDSTGASYYGVMELGGNVWERVVAVHNNTTAYDGQWGDGYLDANGLANTANWFLPATGNNNAASQGVGLRGGGSGAGWAYLRVSNRYNAYINAGDDPWTRGYDWGGRGVR